MTPYHALELLAVAAAVGAAAAYVARRYAARRAAKDAACGGCRDSCGAPEPRAR